MLVDRLCWKKLQIIVLRVRCTWIICTFLFKIIQLVLRNVEVTYSPLHINLYSPTSGSNTTSWGSSPDQHCALSEFCCSPRRKISGRPCWAAGEDEEDTTRCCVDICVVSVGGQLDGRQSSLGPVAAADFSQVRRSIRAAPGPATKRASSLAAAKAVPAVMRRIAARRDAPFNYVRNI